MKKKLMVALMGAGLLAGTLAGPAMAESENACFGRARAEGGQLFRPMGQIIRDRAGDNAELNRQFREFCQGD